VLGSGKKLKISLPDYNVNGDMLSISVDNSGQKLIVLDVNTYIDDPSGKVVFNIVCSDLPGGTQYAGSTTIEAQTKNLRIVIVNSGYKKAAGK
jgi:hypothetical protein